MAMAPQQLGIGIRRHFTTPESIRTTPSSGSGATRASRTSRTAATPSSSPTSSSRRRWSLNATNIVAQKYFRGTLGTPEREWSLRQVIDRVVDTIADWGVRDGYFVDDEEAAAFRDELKYVLVHQRAAFNSPVWFNIGVKGVPQQASVCQPYDALVAHARRRSIPIGELVEQNVRSAPRSSTRTASPSIVAVKHNGRKSVLRVHTKSGIHARRDAGPPRLAAPTGAAPDGSGRGAVRRANSSGTAPSRGRRRARHVRSPRKRRSRFLACPTTRRSGSRSSASSTLGDDATCTTSRPRAAST